MRAPTLISGIPRAPACLLAAALLVPFLPGPLKAQGYQDGFVQVALNPGASIERVNQQHGTTVVDSLPPLYLLAVPPGLDEETLIQRMLDDPDSSFWCAEHAWKTETPEGTRQMVVAAVGGTIDDYLDQNLVARLHLNELHEHTDGQGVTVAVLDTGILAGHEAFAGAMVLDGYDFVDGDDDPSDTADGIDDDEDGFIDSGAGHGTLVAGALHLTAPGAALLPVRVLDDEGRGTTFGVAKGIRYAVSQGADVLNMSLGLNAHSGVIAHELALARLESVAMVAAAGNLGVDTLQYYPASDTKVLMVAALDSSDVKATFSNYHPKVAVSAPGVGVYGPFHDGGYAIGAGTSFATPFASGACALALALEPSLDWETLYHRVTEGVVDIYSIPENLPYRGKLGSGRIDGMRLLATSHNLPGTVETDAPLLSGLQVCPNPAPAGGRIRLLREQEDGASYQDLYLFDPAGRQLQKLGLPAATRGALDLRDSTGRPLPPGVYFLRAILQGGGVVEGRVVVLR